jgi:hypothetical protein
MQRQAAGSANQHCKPRLQLSDCPKGVAYLALQSRALTRIGDRLGDQATLDAQSILSSKGVGLVSSAC